MNIDDYVATAIREYVQAGKRGEDMFGSMKCVVESVVEKEIEACAAIAKSYATCGCGGVHGRCNEDDIPLAIEEEIRARYNHAINEKRSG